MTKPQNSYIRTKSAETQMRNTAQQSNPTNTYRVDKVNQRTKYHHGHFLTDDTDAD